LVLNISGGKLTQKAKDSVERLFSDAARPPLIKAMRLEWVSPID
jgi:hypothetical protein